MSCYRAALAAASMGDLTAAARLAECSLVFSCNPSSARLLEILRPQIRLVREHNIIGLRYALSGRYRKAQKQFKLALALDTGNDLARRAHLACGAAKKRWFFR